jgi:O-methyltransferase
MNAVGSDTIVQDWAGEVGRLRSIFIDLLMEVIIGTIYKDPDENINKIRIEGSGTSNNSYSLIGQKRLKNLRELIEVVIKAGIPGDFIETGVWRGGACILMRGILAAYGIADRFVYLADSFKGVPEPNIDKFPADEHLKGLHKAFEVPIEQVKANFEAFGLLDSQVIFVEGWFKDTLSSLSESRFALIRLDGDLYESTVQALDALYPLLSPGGFVIVDDYGAFEPCRRAVGEYREKHSITAPLQKVDWTGVWWRKPLYAPRPPGVQPRCP